MAFLSNNFPKNRSLIPYTPFCTLLFIIFIITQSCQSINVYKELPQNEQIIHYIYVNSNTGAASGGHTALMLNKVVFHFQNQGNGFFKFERTSFKDFYNRYSELENRSVYIHDIAVSQKSFKLIFKKLSRTWLIQEKNFNLLAQSNEEIKFLEFLLDKKLLLISGAGFFNPQQPFQKKLPSNLKYHIKEIIKYKNHIQDKLENPALSFKAQDAKQILLSTSRYPATRKFPANQYKDSIQAWIAIQALIQGWDLHHTAYFDSSQLLKNYPTYQKAFELDGPKIKILVKYKEELIVIIRNLISNRRIGSGESLLLAVARLRIVTQSIKKRHLLVLDPFSHHGILFNRQRFNKNPKLEHKLRDRLFKRFKQIKSWTFSRPSLHEVEWNGFENVAGFFLEFIQSSKENRPVRMLPQKRIPGKKARLSLENYLSQATILNLKKQAQQTVHISIKRKKNIKRELNRIYKYNIFKKNCATQLVNLANKSFPNEKEAFLQLGGELKKDKLFFFIPFVSYRIVASNWRVIHSKRYLPRRLADIKRTANKGFYKSLKESFVFTSSSYLPNQEDSAFLFFTDDVIWLRPLLGFINFVYATGYSIVSIFKAPFDSGRELTRGTLGMFWSLPELVFFNVRKGSYTIPSYKPPIEQKNHIIKKY